MKVMSAGGFSVSSTTLLKVTGLSVSVAAAGVYQIDGYFIWAASALSIVGYGLSLQTGTISKAKLRWLGNVFATGNQPASIQISTGLRSYQLAWMNSASFGSISYSANMSVGGQVELKGIVAMSTTGGTIQVKTRVGAGVQTVQQGSYLRAFKLA